MVKQVERREISRGVCRFCQGEFAKNKMTQHLKSCKARFTQKTEQDGQEQRLLHVLVEGKYRPEYWMHLEVSAAATLGDLDYFLRTTWLECCDHLSEFKIDGVSYASFLEDGWFMAFNEEEEEEDEADEEEGEEDDESTSLEEVTTEIARRLSDEFHADLSEVAVERIEEKLEQMFVEHLPLERSPALLDALRPMFGVIAQSLHQGTLTQDLQGVVLDVDEEDEEDEGMEAELGEVVNVGEKFSYIYDFGSSSTLSLRVISERSGALPAVRGEESKAEEAEEAEEEIVVMARNEQPALTCHICGQPATQVPSRSEYDSLAEEALCATHAHASEYADELLPLVNSPRAGICGYTGDEDEDEEWDEDDEWDEEEGESEE